MIRIATLAAVAATLVAGSASARSIRISTAGKSAEQVRAEVVTAARKVCALDIVGSSFPLDEMRACEDRTVRVTLAQSHDPAHETGLSADPALIGELRSPFLQVRHDGLDLVG